MFVRSESFEGIPILPSDLNEMRTATSNMSI